MRVWSGLVISPYRTPLVDLDLKFAFVIKVASLVRKIHGRRNSREAIYIEGLVM